MSLNWNWSDKCGEATLVQKRGGKEYEYTLSLYDGNAYLIMLHEYKDEDGEEVYNMYSFWIDKQHMKNCLGLSEGKENLYTDITKFRFSKDKCKHLADIVPALTKAFDKLTIEIYSEEE